MEDFNFRGTGEIDGGPRDKPWIINGFEIWRYYNIGQECKFLGICAVCCVFCPQSPFIQTAVPQTQLIRREKHAIRIVIRRCLSIQGKFTLKWQQQNYVCLCEIPSKIPREPFFLLISTMGSRGWGPATVRSINRHVVKKHTVNLKIFCLSIPAPVHYWNLRVHHTHAVPVVAPFLCNFRARFTDKTDS